MTDHQTDAGDIASTAIRFRQGKIGGGAHTLTWRAGTRRKLPFLMFAQRYGQGLNFMTTKAIEQLSSWARHVMKEAGFGGQTMFIFLN